MDSIALGLHRRINRADPFSDVGEAITNFLSQKALLCLVLSSLPFGSALDDIVLALGQPQCISRMGVRESLVGQSILNGSLRSFVVQWVEFDIVEMVREEYDVSVGGEEEEERRVEDCEGSRGY